MDAPFSPLEFAMLNDFQRDFPLVTEPYAAIAGKMAVDETAVLLALKRLHGKGSVSRVGPVFAPWRIGVSTLAALAVPPGRLEAVAERISARPEVNHNYEREHHHNLWLVATAADEARLEGVLAAIAADAGAPVMSLPLVEQYHIDLGFDLCDAVKHRTSGGSLRRESLSPVEQRLVAALQPGLPIQPRPFATIAHEVGLAEDEVLARIGGWLESGVLKRFGVVVRHRELGYKANAMVVFDVPDAEAAATGARLAAEAGVTLCYRRRRHLPEWPYNLYCMVHGRSREEVMPVIERLCRVAGHPCEFLFSTRRFKQQGARYFDGQ